MNVPKVLKAGGVGVLLTDTIYGLVGRALNKKAVEKIYKIKGRNHKKPLIILIASLKDLKRFGVKVDSELIKVLKKFWPGPVSIILPCRSKKFEYLHRGTKSLAFRLPKKRGLIALIKQAGPLVAPSANPEGLPPARNVKEAQKYFGRQVDFYQKGLKAKGKPSKLIKVSGSLQNHYNVISLR